MTAAAQPDRRAILTEALRKIDELTAKLEIAEKGDTEPIAVVGMGCRFPGGVSTPDEYWQLLRDGASGIVRVPEARWDADRYYSEDYTVPGTICNREGGFLSSWEPDEFDTEFFGIAPREAAAMDPQQRLLLEVAWEAMENAGIKPSDIRGTNVGVFVGLTTNDYSLTFAGKLRPDELDPYVPFGNASNFAAGRLSYFLGVNGPAVVLDTACSSSLVAIHMACQSLRRRESDSALAAGVNLMLSPENTIACSRWGMLAPDGQCKAFDASANGYVRSEGCGVVMLKRLGDAERDGDPILAVVRGSAVNQDGASSGQTVPNGPAQQALLRSALAAARLKPSDIDYIEAHGTGTPLGDPIELDALSRVFADRDGSAPLVLGSVKTNLGHLESAAGVAGFIKTVMSVRDGHIPKQLHFEQLNPHASEGASRLTVASRPMDWPAVERPRRAGVSSFGVSGTNAHVIVEQAPEPTPAVKPVVTEPDPVLSTLVVSAKSAERITSTAEMLADWLEGPGAAVSLPDVAHTVNHHRAGYQTFGTVVARDTEQAVAGLRALAGSYPLPGVVGPHEGACRDGRVFVYSGQGSQWAGMGRRLLADEPAFAAAVAELEPDFVEQVGFSLRGVLESGEQLVGIDRIQPVLVGVQLALTALWRSYGVQPDAVIGHSMGEVAAAVAAGALSPADGLKVIGTRSRLMARLSGQGAMALLELDAAAADQLIADHPDVTVAVYASPRQTVVAGPPDQVDAVIAVVAARDLLARRVEVDVASHHPIIDPILPELRELLADLEPRTPTVPLITTAVAPGTATFDADYWAANLRNPVRFSDALATAGAEHGVFVEVSPHPVLTYAISDALAGVHHHSIGTLLRDGDDTVAFHASLNAVHTTKAPDTPHAPEPHVAIPNTPWHHTRHWVAIPEGRESQWHKGAAFAGGSAGGTTVTGPEPVGPVGQARPGTLLGAPDAVAAGHRWWATLDPQAKPYPGAQRVLGAEVVPVSVLLQTLSAAAAELGAPGLDDVRFDRPVIIDQPRTVLVTAEGGTLTVSSAPSAGERHWTCHVSAQVAQEAGNVALEPADVAAGHQVPDYDPPAVAELQRSWGIEGQPYAWSVQAVRSAPGELHVEVDLPDPSVDALVDAAVQLARLVDGAEQHIMLPVSAGSLWTGPAAVGSRASLVLVRRGGDEQEVLVDVAAKTIDGTVCAVVRSLRFADVDAVWIQPAEPATVAPDAGAAERSDLPDWSAMAPADILVELETRLQGILARELGMPATAVKKDQPFAQLGLDSMMVMTVRRESKQLLGVDLTPTMLWNHPTISSLAGCLADLLAPEESPDDIDAELRAESADSVLDALFDSVESIPASSESGIR